MTCEDMRELTKSFEPKLHSPKPQTLNYPKTLGPEPQPASPAKATET